MLNIYLREILVVPVLWVMLGHPLVYPKPRNTMHMVFVRKLDSGKISVSGRVLPVVYTLSLTLTKYQARSSG